jgi:hypothetical protein
LKEKALFTLIPSANYKEPKTFFDKILSSVGFGSFNTTQDIAVTEEVKGELVNACR